MGILDAFKVTVTQLTDNSIVNRLGSIPTGNQTKIPLRKWVVTEHSPIRGLQFEIVFEGLPAYIANHLKTHFEGFSLQISESNRRDYPSRYGKTVTRDGEAPIRHGMVCNAQSLINVSRKRLCSGADSFTIKVWMKVKEAMMEVNKDVAEHMVVECIYRGGICPEIYHKCKYNSTPHFKREFKKYISGFKIDPTLYNL